MVPFAHQQQAWTIGTSWGPGAFLLSWSAASFDLRKIHGQKTLYFNLTILLFHCHPLSTGYCTWNLQKDSNLKCRSIIIPQKKILVILWVPKNRRRSAPTRIFCMEMIGSPPSGIGIVPPGILLLGSLQELGPATAKTQFGLNLGEGENPTPSQRLGDSLKKLANKLVGKYQPTTVQWSRIFEGKL